MRKEILQYMSSNVLGLTVADRQATWNAMSTLRSNLKVDRNDVSVSKDIVKWEEELYNQYLKEYSA
jgi:hypothetical protein